MKGICTLVAMKLSTTLIIFLIIVDLSMGRFNCLALSSSGVFAFSNSNSSTAKVQGSGHRDIPIFYSLSMHCSHFRGCLGPFALKRKPDPSSLNKAGLFSNLPLMEGSKSIITVASFFVFDGLPIPRLSFSKGAF